MTQSPENPQYHPLPLTLTNGPACVIKMYPMMLVNFRQCPIIPWVVGAQLLGNFMVPLMCGGGQ